MDKAQKARIEAEEPYRNGEAEYAWFNTRNKILWDKIEWSFDRAVDALYRAVMLADGKEE